jgi:hypothetical protein
MARDRIQVATQYVILAVYQIWESLSFTSILYPRYEYYIIHVYKQIIINYSSLITTQQSESSGKHLFGEM